MAKRGKYAAFVNHVMHQESGEPVPVEQLALQGDAHVTPNAAGSAASGFQTALQETAAALQREFLGGRSASSDGAEGASAQTVRPVPIALLRTVSELRRTLQQIEDASAIRLPLGDEDLMLTLSKTSSSSQPGSEPGTPKADGGLNGIAGTDYRSPRYFTPPGRVILSCPAVSHCLG
jgi:hypothetical protein